MCGDNPITLLFENQAGKEELMGKVLVAIAVALFLLCAFGVGATKSLQLLPLGLAFWAGFSLVKG